MARKKKEEAETVDYQIDLSKLSLTKDKYVDQIQRFIEEHVANSKVSRPSSSIINVNVPLGTSKQMVKLRVIKALYTTGLKAEYRLVSMINKDANGYLIVER